MNWRIDTGDCRELMRAMEPASVQTVVTSPPYFGLRDYGTATWEGGDPDCDHIRTEQQRTQDHRPVWENGFKNTKKSIPVGYKDECGKCGAHRIDTQIGLESSVEEYVGNLVDVFREVRRVLRDDGIVWLNLGDSYNAGRDGGHPGGSAQWDPEEGKYAERSGANVAGLKPKDLIGIPWRVARALQEPYYAGKIKSEADRIWLAAMIDAEGCMFIHRRKAGQSNGQGYVRKADSFGAGLEVASTDRVIVDRCMAITGLGSIGEQAPTEANGRKQTIYRWHLRSNVCREVVREVYPHLTAKQREARLLCGCPSSGDQARAAWEALKSIHQGECAPDIDFPAPESMFEAGWFLRSEIIWSKLLPNPMPESVTDRPTKAHEQVFLLAKSPSYYYDAFAIREQDVGGHASGNTFEDRQGGSERVGGRSGGEGGGEWQPGGGRNKRSVWLIATVPFKEAHFATFPPKLAEPCILAGSPPEVCGRCGAPRRRQLVKSRTRDGEPVEGGWELDDGGRIAANGVGHWRFATTVESVGWLPTCACGAPEGVEPDDLELIESPTSEVVSPLVDPSKEVGRAGYARPRKEGEGRRTITRYQQRRYAEQLRQLERPEKITEDAWAHYLRTDRSGARPLPPKLLEEFLRDGKLEPVEPPEWELPPGRPPVVLDPFAGAGTTGLVALRNERSFLGLELNPDYAELARNRLRDDAPLLNCHAEDAEDAGAPA